ncbi:NAD-dependent epimerase/dehydratase family protein [Rhodospirillaceae bacterium AH-315-P19]|nr:NAD-dependent epimerase/dehydratase family protein [Rhodospirillaceae bacterium AH-315-P19]
MTTLLTGASGFVGSAVLRALLAADHDVRVLLRETSDRRNLEGLHVEVVTGDLRDRPSLDRAIKGCEALFHVAADYRIWVRNPETLYDSNVTGVRQILEAAGEAGVSRIVHTSSVAALGLPKNGGVGNEETPVTLANMIGHYKRSKFLGEEEVRRLVAKGLPVVTVNPSAPVGPRDIKPTPTGHMIAEAASGRMPAYVDTGLNVVHVDDVAAGHLLAFEKGKIGRRYVLGGENLTLREILQKIAVLTGRPAPRFRIPHNAIFPIAVVAEAWTRLSGGDQPFVSVDSVRMSKKRMFYSNARARQELGYAPRPVDEAFRDAVTWFSQHGICLPPKIS